MTDAQTQHEYDLYGDLDSDVRTEPRFPLSPWVTAICAVGCIVLALTMMLYSQRQNEIATIKTEISTSRDFLNELDTVQELILDAETGQRGFIITMKPSYLRPYTDASHHVSEHMHMLQRLAVDDPADEKALARLTPFVEDKMDELKTTIALRQTKGLSAAMELIASDRGRNDMDQIRSLLTEMREREHDELFQKMANLHSHAGRLHAYLYAFMATASLVVGFFVYWLSGYLTRVHQWYQSRQSRHLEAARRQLQILHASMPELQAARQKVEEDIKLQESMWNHTALDETLAVRANCLSQIVGTIVACFAIILVVGCILNVGVLRNPTPWGAQTKINAAICLLLTGIAIVVSHTKWRSAPKVVFTLGAIIFAISGVSLCEWLFGWNPGIDQLLLSDFRSAASAAPGRMSGGEALAFILLGASTVALGKDRLKLSQVCASVATCIGLVTLTGHTYGFENLLSFGNGILISFPMSIALTLSGFGLFLVRPDGGYASVSVSRSLGGRLLRRLLPMVFLVPAIGLSSGMGQSTLLDLFLLAVTTTILFPAMVFLVARMVDQLDRQKDLALSRAFGRKEELEFLNRELEKARDQALEASHLKSAFVANISHELRTPLSCIIGNAEILLQAKHPPAEELPALQTTLSCAQSLLQIVNDLLDLSKIESGKFSLESSTFSLRSLSDSVISTVGDAARKKMLVLKVYIDPLLPDNVTGDRLRVRQILLNLLNNAIKFTAEGEVQLRIMPAQPSPDDGVSNIRFEVSDTGIGISKANQKLLFQPFSQVDSSATRKYGGAGLGLSLCKNLVELMGGELGVRSVIDKGSVFWCVLPLGVSKQLDFSPTPSAQVKPLANAGDKVILVVEDNMVVQKIVLKQLSSLGVQSVAASTGVEALEMLSSSAFDLILMDCNLPDLSGLDVTKQIRVLESADGGHTPIVAMTAAAMKGDREKCIEAGMDDYLSKPVAIAQLRETLEKWTSPSPPLGPEQKTNLHSGI